MLPSHIDVAHFSWKKVLHNKAKVIDATCGNGHDTLFICQNLNFTDNWKGPLGSLNTKNNESFLYCFDLQKEAIKSTKMLLAKNQINCQKISFIHDCHSRLDQHLEPLIDLIIYNLGYLPGSCKTIKTQESTTLESIQKAMQLIRPGGIISITCYPGHEEGLIEQKSIFSLLKMLRPNEWAVTHYNPFSATAPNLLLLSKRK
jgi:tRNA G37 N-methylase Trm5